MSFTFRKISNTMNSAVRKKIVKYSLLPRIQHRLYFTSCLWLCIYIVCRWSQFILIPEICSLTLIEKDTNFTSRASSVNNKITIINLHPFFHFKLHVISANWIKIERCYHNLVPSSFSFITLRLYNLIGIFRWLNSPTSLWNAHFLFFEFTLLWNNRKETFNIAQWKIPFWINQTAY